jgi:hypothetical protein
MYLRANVFRQMYLRADVLQEKVFRANIFRANVTISRSKDSVHLEFCQRIWAFSFSQASKTTKESGSTLDLHGRRAQRIVIFHRKTIVPTISRSKENSSSLSSPDAITECGFRLLDFVVVFDDCPTARNL